MDGNRQTRSEKEIAKRNRVLEGRCVLQHVTTKFCNIDFSNKKIFKEKMSLFCRFFSLSPHILPYTYRGQRERRMNKGGVRQGTTTDIRCERKKQGDKKASERRANAEKRVKGE